MEAHEDYVWPRATSELILLPVTGLECVGERLLAGEVWVEARASGEEAERSHGRGRRTKGCPEEDGRPGEGRPEVGGSPGGGGYETWPEGPRRQKTKKKPRCGYRGPSQPAGEVERAVRPREGAGKRSHFGSEGRGRKEVCGPFNELGRALASLEEMGRGDRG